MMLQLPDWFIAFAPLLLGAGLNLYWWMRRNALTHTRDWYEDRVIVWIQKDLRPLPLASWEDPRHPAYDAEDIDNIRRKLVSAFQVPSHVGDLTPYRPPREKLPASWC